MRNSPVLRRDSPKDSPSHAHRRTFKRTDTNQTVTTLGFTQQLELEVKSGLLLTTFMENGGREIAALIISKLGKARFSASNHNPLPVVLVLVSDTRAGLYGMAAARHLCARCRVMVLALRQGGDSVNEMEDEINYFKMAGGHYVSDLKKLREEIASISSPVEVVIDALLGGVFGLADLWDEEEREQITHTIHMVNTELNAMVASVECPSGLSLNHSTKQTIHIQPNLTICLGTPKDGLVKMDAHLLGQLFVVDIGLCQKLFKFVKKNPMPWHGDWVIAIE